MLPLYFAYAHQQQHSSNAAADADFDTEAIRAYELQKLKYYFGVVQCSSTVCAANVYKEVRITSYNTHMFMKHCSVVLIHRHAAVFVVLQHI